MDSHQCIKLNSVNYNPGLRLTFPPSATPHAGSCQLPHKIHRSGTGTGFANVSQGSDRRSLAALRPRILQQNFRRPEGVWWVAPRHRSLQTKSVSQGSKVQNGDDRVHSSCSSRQLLGHRDRFIRCLLPRTHPHQSPPIPPVHVQQQGLAVQGPTIWTGDSPFLLYMDPETFRPSAPCAGRDDSRLSGRLVASPLGPGNPSASCPYHPSDCLKSRFSNKFPQVTTDSKPGCSVPGSRSEFTTPNVQASSAEVPGHSADDPDNSAQISQTGFGVEHPPRQVDISREVCAPRQAPHQATAMAYEDFLDLRLESGPRARNSPYAGNGPTSSLVVGHTNAATGHAHSTTDTNDATLHGRQHRRLGSASSGSHLLGALVSPGEETTHQRPGDDGHHQSGISLPQHAQRPDAVDSHRQFHSAGLSKEPGWYKEPPDDTANSDLLQVGSGSETNVCLSPHSGSAKHFGGSTFTTVSSDPDRMDDETGSVGFPVEELAPSSDRCVRHMLKPSDGPILLSSSGSRGISGGPSRTDLGMSQPVQVPAVPTDPKGSQEDFTPASRRNSTNPSMEPERRLVPATSTINHKTRSDSHSVTSEERSVVPTTLRTHHGECSVPQSSRIATITSCLRKRKASSRVINMVTQSTADSTKAVYDGKWTFFAEWCASKSILPTKIKAEQLADFLHYLIQSRNPAMSTYKGYLSAIQSVLTHCDRKHVVASSLVNGVTKFLRRQQSKLRVQPPKWNLAFVLHRLNSAPFEPLQQADLKFLTWKTAFLLILATACRRSELHALDFKSIRKAKDWAFVDLFALPEFQAKYQFLDADPSAPRAYTIKTLQVASEEDRMSCPVRALRLYLRHTKAFRKGRRRLFLPISASASDITANTISHWVKQTLLLAYQTTGNPTEDAQDRHLFNISDEERRDFTRPAHEIRAQSASFAFASRHYSLASLLRSCYWRSHTVFTEFYLRDITVQDNKEMLHLAAQYLPGGQDPSPPQRH